VSWDHNQESYNQEDQNQDLSMTERMNNQALKVSLLALASTSL